MKQQRFKSKVDILIVEDSPTQSEQLKYTLEQHGYSVRAAQHGGEALAMIHERRPTVVITDIVMPEMDGYELCRRIRSDTETSAIPIILLTSLSDFFDVIRGLECGADHFLVKPCDEDYLLSKIEYILAHRHLQFEDFSQLALEITLRGHKYSITSTRMQILNLLLSSFESAVQKNRELKEAQDCLQNLNASLEEKVRERTASLASEIADRIAVEVQLRHRLELEEAVAQISRLLVSSVEPDIHLILAILGKVLDVQRTSLFRFRNQFEKFDNTHEWCAGGTPSTREYLQDLKTSDFPWTIERLRSGDAIVLKSSEGLPPVAAQEIEKLKVELEYSKILIPYFSKSGMLYGFFRFDDTQSQRDWNEYDVRSLRIVAEMFASSIDIKEAQHAVREKEKLYRDAIQVANAVPYYQNYSTNTYDFIGGEITALTGYSPEEFTPDFFSKNIIEIILIEDLQGLTLDEAILKVRNEAGLNWKADFQVRTKDGRLKWLTNAAVQVRDESGRAIGSLGILQDITERKRIESALKESEQRLRFAMESAKMGTWEWDISTGKVVWDEGTYRIFGRDREAFDGNFQSFLQTIHPEDRKHIEGNIDRFYPYESTIETEYRVLWPDNSIHYIASKGKIHTSANGEPVRMVGICWDITNEKSLEEQLRQAQKMDAIGQLAGGIAHDFNNLLMVINGYGECLLQELDQSDKKREEIEEIVNAGNRAASLTRQLLAFSRKQVVQPEILNINTVLKNLEKMLQRLIGEHIELVFHASPDLRQVRIDPGQIEQVILNVCINARDAMPKGGKITIETQNIELKDEYALNHYDVTPGQYVLIAVSDTGIGMTKEIMNRIFEPFFTTKEFGKGTGLGLSTVYGIVKQNSGHIWVYSEPGRGTTFKVYLPVCEPDQSAREMLEGMDAIQGSESILVVEDELAVRKLMERILVNAGYTVYLAGDGEDAIARFGNAETAIHLLITDMVMPKMGGPELAEKMKAFYPGLKVLFVSGYTETALLRNGTIGEGMIILQKPVDSATLLKKIRDVVQ